MAIRRVSTASIKTGSKSNKFWDQDTAQGALEPIASWVAPGTNTGVDFTNIPQTYTDLMIVQQVRSNRSANTYELFWQRLNGDTGSNYSYTYLNGNGTTGTSSRLSSQTVTNRFNIPASNATTGVFGTSIIHILNYSNSSNFKTLLCRSSTDLNGSGEINFSVGLWRNTSAITSVNLATETGSNVVAGSIITLYGIK